MKTNELIFLNGENIKLCVPDEEDNSAIDIWTAMINDQEINKFIGQGYYPQSRKDQIKYIQETLANRTRILLEIRAIKSNKFLGVTSLSDIDQTNKRAQLSVVSPYKCETVKYAGLQARAILTDHAFRKLGLRTVYSYPAYPENRRWAQASEIIGYLPSGFVLESYFYDGGLTNRLIMSITEKRYWEYSSQKKSLWPGCKAIERELANLKGKPSLADDLFKYVRALQRLDIE
jgi:RimJ/RimL family protein N-acetyltransferase